MRKAGCKNENESHMTKKTMTRLAAWTLAPLAAAGLGAAVPAIAQSANALASVQSHLKSTSSMTADRSEEHTSELQSLMRISYAVFCLKKKKNNGHNFTPTSHNTTYITEQNVTSEQT